MHYDANAERHEKNPRLDQFQHAHVRLRLLRCHRQEMQITSWTQVDGGEWTGIFNRHLTLKPHLLNVLLDVARCSQPFQRFRNIKQTLDIKETYNCYMLLQ